MDALQSKHVGFYRGQKQYEIGNHLDNVLVTVSDKKLPDTTSAGNHAYLPDIVSATDYYPFGAQIPGRKMNTGAYGHGFQGKEKDDVIKGEGNSYYFKERMYDPRVGRWLSVDPKAGKFPGRTPYNGMGNNPVNRIDPDGAEDESSEKKSFPERMDEKSATTFEPNLFGGQDKYEDALDLWNEGKKKEAVQTAMIADYERNIDVLTEEGKKTLKGYTKKQLMKQGEKAIKGMLAKDKVGIKLVEAYEKGKGFHEKVTGFIDKASSAKKIYEAWADMPDDIRGNRAEAARQFDKMFGAAGELMEDVPLAGNYSNILTEFSEKGFFINFVNLNHLNTPESAMEYMPDTDEYRERQRKHREKWGR
jgi:RHS repeat-associated protein